MGWGSRRQPSLAEGLHGYHDSALQDEGQGPPLHLPLLDTFHQRLQSAHCLHSMTAGNLGLGKLLQRLLQAQASQGAAEESRRCV